MQTVAGVLGAARFSFGMALLFSPASTLRFFWPDEEGSRQTASELARHTRGGFGAWDLGLVTEQELPQALAIGERRCR